MKVLIKKGKVISSFKKFFQFIVCNVCLCSPSISPSPECVPPRWAINCSEVYSSKNYVCYSTIKDNIYDPKKVYDELKKELENGLVEKIFSNFKDEEVKECILSKSASIVEREVEIRIPPCCKKREYYQCYGLAYVKKDKLRELQNLDRKCEWIQKIIRCMNIKVQPRDFADFAERVFKISPSEKEKWECIISLFPDRFKWCKMKEDIYVYNNTELGGGVESLLKNTIEIIGEYDEIVCLQRILEHVIHHHSTHRKDDRLCIFDPDGRGELINMINSRYASLFLTPTFRINMEDSDTARFKRIGNFTLSDCEYMIRFWSALYDANTVEEFLEQLENVDVGDTPYWLTNDLKKKIYERFIDFTPTILCEPEGCRNFQRFLLELEKTLGEEYEKEWLRYIGEDVARDIAYYYHSGNYEECVMATEGFLNRMEDKNITPEIFLYRIKCLRRLNREEEANELEERLRRVCASECYCLRNRCSE